MHECILGIYTATRLWISVWNPRWGHGVYPNLRKQLPFGLIFREIREKFAIGETSGAPYTRGVAGEPSKSKRPQRLKGRLLLSDPSLRDGVFNRSVVLITQHSATEGAHGLIINHPSENLVGNLLKSPEFAPLRTLRVFQGGPVESNQLTFASFSWQPSRGLRHQLPLSIEKAVAMSHRPGTLVRPFVGYSGWAAGQLEDELARNAWIVVKPEDDLLGHDHARPLWAELMRRVSPFHRILAASPDEPWFN